MDSLMLHPTTQQSLIVSEAILLCFNKYEPEWSRTKPASSQQQWLHGIASLPHAVDTESSVDVFEGRVLEALQA